MYYVLGAEWEQAVQRWADTLTAAGQSAETIRVRKAIVRHVAHLSGVGHPADVDADTLVALCAGQSWSVDHRRSVRTSLRGFYGWCVSRGVTATNPADGLPKVGESKPRPRPVTDEAWQQFLAVAGPRERLAGRLAAEAGMRRAEVAQARRDDLIEDLSGWSIIVRGKGDRQRIVPINDDLAQEVLARPDGFLFPNGDGHLTANCVGKLVSSLLPAGVSMHKLRHRYASRGYAGTRNLVAVQKALGHASLATTQRYVATAADEVRAVSEAAA